MTTRIPTLLCKRHESPSTTSSSSICHLRAGIQTPSSQTVLGMKSSQSSQKFFNVSFLDLSSMFDNNKPPKP